MGKRIVRAVPFPVGGASNRGPFHTPVPLSCPPQSIRNVRPFDTSEGRERGGRRPGLRKLFAQQIGNGLPVQCLATVSRAAATTGYTIGECDAAMEDWESRAAGALTGQAWLLNTIPSMARDFYLDTTGLGGAGTESVSDVRWSPDGTKVALLLNSSWGGSNRAVVAAYTDTGTQLWQTTLSGATPFTSYSLEYGSDFVFVCCETYLYVLNASTGVVVYQYRMNLWALRALCAKVRTTYDGRLMVLFYGESSGTTLPSGTPVWGGIYASHFRSGIAKYRIDPNYATADQVLVWEQFGTEHVDSSNTFYEANHGYLRFSEQGYRRPWGFQPAGMAINPDGQVVVVHSNQGWGPNGTYRPDASIQYASVTKFSRDGAPLWQTDTDSNRDTYTVGADTFYTDINNPTMVSAAMDNDMVFVAGRRNAAGATDGSTVFCLDGDDGAVLWEYNTSGAVATRNGLAIDPADKNLWVAGTRNTNWTGSGGAQAHLWKLDRQTGTVIETFDLNETNIDALGIHVNGDGLIIYCTEHVT